MDEQEKGAATGGGDEALERLLAAFERRRVFWRDCKDDPHGIAQAVYACMTDCCEAVREALG